MTHIEELNDSFQIVDFYAEKNRLTEEKLSFIWNLTLKKDIKNSIFRKIESLSQNKIF
jgi:hypothetical protein